MRDDTDRPREGQDPPARHLRLVHPRPIKPKRRRGVSYRVEDVFAPAEVAKLRLAFDNARRGHFRSWTALAAAMGVHRDTLRLAGVRHTLTAGIAYRFARTVGTTVDALLATSLRVVPAPHVDGAS